MWPDRRLLDLLGIAHPIIQAPMAGASTAEMAIAAGEAGALGSLACATLTLEGIRDEIGLIRQGTDRPLNVNFFCHAAPDAAAAADREAAWRGRLRPYHAEFGLDPDAEIETAIRKPFDEETCALVEECRPEVVSFHFGLPAEPLLRRVKATGAVVLGSATTVAEARWLAAHGAHGIIAQGAEAGGHRGMFLTDRVWEQPGTFALVPQVVDAVDVPVIAAGGVADARGIAAALALGAAGVQVGTAYLFCPESRITPPHREALAAARDDGTALTNLFTGRPARGLVNRLMREVGPLSDLAPSFPLAATALAPLRKAAEGMGSGDFSPLWAGQAAALGRPLGAAELTRRLAAETLARMSA